MKSILILSLLFTVFNSAYTNMDIELVRQNYGLAASNETLCNKMIEELKTNDKNTIYLAYLGAYQTIWANHVLSPFSKLNTFNAGVKNIEKAIKKDPNNVEIRFLRYSVQKNAPSFLGYNKEKAEDEKFLKKSKEDIKSKILLKMINDLLND